MNASKTLRFVEGAGTLAGSKCLIFADGSPILTRYGLLERCKPSWRQNWPSLPVGASSLHEILATPPTRRLTSEGFLDVDMSADGRRQTLH